LHNHKTAVVNQREVGEDTYSFAAALKHVLRQDPDVILVGEMRDLETISTALTAAETGHLVFATLHTQDAPQSVDRVIDVFPAHQQQQIRVQLAGSLEAESTSLVVNRLRQMGYVPIAIDAKDDAGLKKELKLPFGGKPKLKDIAVFSRQFATMINSGLSLLRSLYILAEQTENK